MQIPTQPTKVVTAEPVLVPPVIHRSYVPGKNQQKRWQRTQLVDPHPLLELHPLHYLRRVVPGSPPLQVDDHHAGVEVTRLAAFECEGKRWVGPKRRREVGGEVGVAVLGSGEDGLVAERCRGELCNVVDEDQVGVEVNDAADTWREEIG